MYITKMVIREILLEEEITRQLHLSNLHLMMTLLAINNHRVMRRRYKWYRVIVLRSDEEMTINFQIYLTEGTVHNLEYFLPTSGLYIFSAH